MRGGMDIMEVCVNKEKPRDMLARFLLNEIIFSKGLGFR